MATLYCRARDGGYRVDFEQGKYHLHAPGGPYQYSTVRALIAHITGHPKGRNWTLSRYFRIPNTIDAQPPWGALRSVGQPVKEKAIGTDLKAKHTDVKKIFFHGFSNRMPFIRSSVLDPEDLLQDLYLAILSRNQKTSGFDPKKSSFSHYVHMVGRTVLNQSGRKQLRWNKEVLPTDEQIDVEDEGFSAPIAEDNSMLKDLVAFLKDHDGALASQTAVLLSLGFSDREIATSLGKSLGEARQIVAHVRTRTREWLASD